jgi:dihydroorotate dehydrogenase (NAD+) catalytic subunit
VTSPLLTNLAGIQLRNPVILAAGTAGILDEMADVLPLSALGAITTKSITPKPRDGNDTWRIIEAGPAGMLNAIGLANPGIDLFLSHHAPKAARLPCHVITSVAGFSVEDYHQCCALIDAHVGDALAANTNPNIAALELNVSCPNVHTGTEFGHTPGLITELLKVIRPAVKHVKLFVKLSPAAPDLAGVAKACCEQGVDAITLGNTFPAMAIDVHTRKPKLANVTGGLSGPALHPIWLRFVYDINKRICKPAGVPTIAAGGVMSYEHAAAFILAGATAFQIGTGLFADPKTPQRVIKGLGRWCQRQGVASLGELRGALELPSK